jgi:hypothetical protein
MARSSKLPRRSHTPRHPTTGRFATIPTATDVAERKVITEPHRTPSAGNIAARITTGRAGS